MDTQVARRWRLGTVMVVAALLTFIVSMGVVNAQTVGEEHTFSVHVAFDPDSPAIDDDTTPLAYAVTVTRDGGAVDAGDESLAYTGPGDISAFTVDALQTAFGMGTDAAADDELATTGIDLPFSITPTAAGEYVVSLQFVIDGTPEGAPIDTAFTVDAPPPPPPPVVVATPIPIVMVGDLAVPVVNQVTVPVMDGAQAEAATTSSPGVAGSAIAPAGVLPAGTQLSASGIVDLDNLEGNAPIPDGSTLRLGFVFQARGSDGNLLEDPFTGQVVLQFSLPAGSIAEGTAPTDLVLVYWDGSAWVEVNASTTVNEDGSATIVAGVDHFTIFAVLERPGYRAFAPALADAGVTLASWGGGSLDALVSAVGIGGSVWVFTEGEPTGYTAGAPAFVNAAFMAMFPDGVPAGTAAVVAR